MISKLVAKDSHERKPFKPQIYKSRGQSRSHDRRAYQTRPNDRNRRYDMNNSTRQNYRDNRFRENFRRDYRQDTRERYRNREIIVMIELGIGIGQETEILWGVMEGTGALTAVDPDQDPEQYK